MSVDIALGDTRLRGTVNAIFGSKQIHLMIGSEKGKRFIKPWLSLLARSAQSPGEFHTSYLVLASAKAQPAFQLSLSGTTPDENKVTAHTILSSLIALYRQGMRTPLPLFEQSSWAFAKATYSHLSADDFSQGLPALSGEAAKDFKKAFKAARAGWEGGFYSIGDRENEHVHRVFADTNPILAQDPSGREILNPVFAETALRFWGPLLHARSSVEVSS